MLAARATLCADTWRWAGARPIGHRAARQVACVRAAARQCAASLPVRQCDNKRILKTPVGRRRPASPAIIRANDGAWQLQSQLHCVSAVWLARRDSGAELACNSMVSTRAHTHTHLTTFGAARGRQIWGRRAYSNKLAHGRAGVNGMSSWAHERPRDDICRPCVCRGP